MKKRIAAVLVTALLLLLCTACGQNAEHEASADGTSHGSDYEGNAITTFLENGYTYNGIGTEGDENGTVLTVWFNSPDKTDCALIEASLTEEEAAAWDGLDVFSDTYDEDLRQFLADIPSDAITVTGLNDQIPAQDTLDAYAGKTLGELEADGYEWYTDDTAEDGTDLRVYHHYDTNLNLAITMEGGVPNLLELSDEEIAAVKIESVRFWGFGD